VFRDRLRETRRLRGRWRYSTLSPRLNSRGEAVGYAKHEYHLRVAGLWLRVPRLAYMWLAP
jgi:hypothetical protein